MPCNSKCKSYCGVPAHLSRHQEWRINAVVGAQVTNVVEIPATGVVGSPPARPDKGVAVHGSRTKGRRGGVWPKAEKKKWPPPIWRWKWSATCLLQLWQLRMSLRCVPVLLRMPTLRTAMPNSSEGILLMTHGIQTLYYCHPRRHSHPHAAPSRAAQHTSWVSS